MASKLPPVFDPNDNVPSVPPPSYDDALQDPQFDPHAASAGPQRPQRPPQHYSQQQFQQQQTYNRPQAPPQRPPQHQTQPQTQPQANRLQLRPSTVQNPNPYLPWTYPDSVGACKKCNNTGFKLKNGKPCSKCWRSYRPGVIPPSTQRELEHLVRHPPQPQRINPGVQSLPPGVTMIPPMGQMGPAVVRPGDPRIGGILCPRCKGKGLVHFFLDTETCSVCRGMGRVNFNGRPL